MATSDEGYQHIEHGFEPVFDERSRVLVLGSFPSVLSRANAFYYGNPQNRFWRVMAMCLGMPVPPNEGDPLASGEPATLDASIAAKRAMLLNGGVALWDAIESCDIKGSSDASIRNVVPAHIERITDAAPIEVVVCNGGTAGRLYKRYLQDRTGLPAIVLPSTSPANAAWHLERLVERWREAVDWAVIYLDFCLSVGAQTFQNASPDRRGHGWLGANHAVGVDVGGIAAAKSLCMLDGAAHAHSAHKLIHRFRKWSAQEAHAWGMAKRCDAAAGADGNAATPQLVMALTCLVQANGGPTRLLSALLCGSNHGIDTRSRAAKVLKRLLDSSQRLVVSHIFNGQHDAIGNAAGVICLQVDRAGECGAGKLSIGGDGILQVPEQKLKIGAIGNVDIRNVLQRFWYIAARGRLHAASFPVGFRLGYTVRRRPAALS